jgi:hypothetical protein
MRFLLCLHLAHGPRRPGRQSAPSLFVGCSSCSCSPFVSNRCGFEFSLGEVLYGPRVPGGRSAGAWRTVRVLPADGTLFRVVTGGSVCIIGWSAAQGRTVRGVCADSPPHLAGRSAPPGRTVRQSLSALFLGSIPPFLLSCFHVCFKESFLRLEVDP